MWIKDEERPQRWPQNPQVNQTFSQPTGAKTMKASEFISLREDQPFWATEGSDERPDVYVKRYEMIFTLGWDAPCDADSIEFVEYVKPPGWQPPEQKVLNEFQHQRLCDILRGHR